MRTIEEAIRAASTCLRAAGLEDPRMESEFLVAAFLGLSRGYLILHRQDPFAETRLEALQGWVSERQRRKPLAYVTGEQPFRDLNLTVSPDVLVPRPETELLVEQAMRLLDGMSGGASVVDVGTGSGAIAISLTSHANVRRIFGIDLSPYALKVARGNARQSQRMEIEWLQGHLLEPLSKRGHVVDMVVANLPYIRTEDLATLAPELHWEPRMALDGGKDGLQLIGPCIDQAAAVLRPGGVLLLEIGADQASHVIALLEKSAAWEKNQVFRDLSGLPRIVQSRRKDY